MRNGSLLAVAARVASIAGLLVLAGGCATATEWTAWRSHPTHFASESHLTFSLRNTEASRPRVARHDIILARQQGWWGDPVTVPQDRIVER